MRKYCNRAEDSALRCAFVRDDPVFFPLLLNLQGRKCVMVGAGTIAAAKIRGLLICGARIVVVSPRAAPAIQRQARAGQVQWRRREFSPRDLRGALLAVAATDSPEVNAAVFRACAARGVLCNSVDDPNHSHFFYPAVARRGPLQIAISTGGRSPALAARLRREIEKQFGPEWNAWLEELGKLRSEVLGSNMPAAARCERLKQLASAQAFRAYLRSARNKTTSPGARRKRAR